MKTNINASAITDDRTLQTVSADLSKLDVAGREVNLAVEELSKIKIISNKQQVDDTMALLKICKEIEKAIETRRKELVTPFNTTVKVYNDYAKNLTSKLSGAIDKVKDVVLLYQKEEEKKALLERTVKREAALVQLGFTFDGDLNLYKMPGIGSMSSNELQHYDDRSFNSILDAWAAAVNAMRTQNAQQTQEENELNNLFGGDSTSAIAVADIAPVVVAPVNGIKSEAVKGTTKRWTFEVTDISQIPREYLVVDETAIRDAINQGVRTIPGVNIFQKEGLSIR